MNGKRIALAAGCVAAVCAGAGAQTILIDFDNAPLHTPLPLDVTASGLTAHLSATGQGYSIQQANTLGFTPAGFAGLCIYPSSIYAADLIVDFSHDLSAFSIMYSPQELGCDDTATMRVTAYENGTYVGMNTATAPTPGTWPTGTLTFGSTLPFNHVVVHYDSRPPTCQDYGVIFLADNMQVTLTSGAPCYANCDNSVNPPVLNVADFTCFLQEFAQGQSYANCDGSTAQPVLNVADFTCFLQKFAQGCP